MNRHRKGAISRGLVVLAIVTSTAAAAQAQDDRPTLAIVEFQTTPAGTVLPPPQLGSTIVDLILDKLVASDRFRVLDGRWLPGGATHGITAGGLEALRASAEAYGVDYLVLGSVTRFSTENRRRSLGAAALFRPILGGMRRHRTELALALAIRVVDVRSGEVMTTVTAQGRSGRKTVSLGALGPLRGGAGALSIGASGFRDALLDEALQRAVAGAAEGLVNAAPRLTRARSNARSTRYKALDLVPDRRFDWNAVLEVSTTRGEGSLTRVPRVLAGRS